MDSLTVDSAFGALDLAIAYDQLELQQTVKEYILKNFGPVRRDIHVLSSMFICITYFKHIQVFCW